MRKMLLTGDSIYFLVRCNMAKMFRVRFIVDVKESVAECIENERVRIGFELNRMPDIRRKTARASSSSSNDSDPKHSKCGSLCTDCVYLLFSAAGTLAIGRNSS